MLKGLRQTETIADTDHLMKLRSETIDPARLTPSQRAELCRNIADITAMIFDGVTYERIQSHVVEAPAEQTHIRLYYGPNDALMGYFIFHRYDREYGGKRVIILRVEAGLVPEARGHRMIRQVLSAALWLKLKHPFRRMFYLDTLVHASSYHLFHRYTPFMYPAPNRNIPPALMPLINSVLATFPDPMAHQSDPLVRKVGWITREADKKNAPRDDSSGARFFKSRNPGYVSGEGLVVVIPVTLTNIRGGAFRVAQARIISLFRSSPDP